MVGEGSNSTTVNMETVEESEYTGVKVLTSTTASPMDVDNKIETIEMVTVETIQEDTKWKITGERNATIYQN